MVNNPTCEELAEQLDAYHDDELAPDERAIVEQHVSACAACSSQLADLARLVFDLKALPRLSPSRDLADSIDFAKFAAASAPLAASLMQTEEALPTMALINAEAQLSTVLPLQTEASLSTVPPSQEQTPLPLAAVSPSELGASGKVVQLRSRLWSGMLGAAVAAAVLVFAVSLHKQSQNSTEVANAPSAQIVGPGTTPAPASARKDLALVEGANTVKSPAQAEQQLPLLAANNPSTSDLAKAKLRAEDAKPRSVVTPAEAESHVSSVPQESIASAVESAPDRVQSQTIEIAALADGEDDSLGVAIDEDGLYDIKI